MNIIVLQGQDTQKSYARLTKFIETAKSRGWEIVYDEFPNTSSLFGAERLIVFKDYKKITDNDIKNFQRFEGTIVIYKDGDLPQTFLKQMPQNFKLEKFDLPKLIFNFLESFYPGNARNCISYFHKVIKTEPVELVFYLLSKQLRDLYLILNGSGSKLLTAWKIVKLKSQVKHFDTNSLKVLIADLAETDILVKTSKADLTSSLDLTIVKQLK